MIPFGQLLILVALAASAAAIVAKAWKIWANRTELEGWYRNLTATAAVALAAAFLLLILLFLQVDVSVLYVWTYTAVWIPTHYRVAGAWTGREGSLLLWTALMAGVVAMVATRNKSRHELENSERNARDWTDFIMASILFLFALAVARQGTFAPTESFLLTGRPLGNGISPALKSGYMLIHPPMMFLAYAITIVPAAAGLSHLITGHGKWSLIAARTSRINWVLYTFAMGLGGMWAYYTLGFGGYWAWDPVEVANLLPWLALTLYLHAQMMHGRKGWFNGIGPMLAIFPFLLTVFSTVSTRSGLWVSVHAFTDPANTFNPDAAARLLSILDVDASLLPYFSLILGILLFALAAWTLRLSADHDVLPRASRIVAAALAAVAGMALLTPALLLSLAFEFGAIFDAPGLGALALLAIAILAAAAPALWSSDEPAEKADAKRGTNLRKYVSVPVLAGVSVMLLSILLVISLMWHFGAVNGWSEKFWDDRVPWLMTPVVLALTVLMLHGRGKKQALLAASALLVGALAAFVIGGLGYYAVFLAGGFLLACVDKLKSVAFTGTRTTRWGSFLLWAAALFDLAFWVDPPTRLLGGAITPVWPVHLVMIPLAIATIFGAHMVAAGRSWRWPYVVAALLGGYYVAPVLALAAWVLHQKAAPKTRPINWSRFRPTGVYGVHFALAVLLLGYAASTYFETRSSHEILGTEGSFNAGGVDYAAIGLGQNPDDGVPDSFSLAITTLQAGSQDSHAVMAWEPQTGTYRPLPGVLRLWDRDIYVTLDAVCTGPLDTNNTCPPGGWLQADTLTSRLFDSEPTAARFTAWSLPGINGVWTAFSLFVIYGIPVAALPDKSAMRKPQQPKP